MAGMLARRLALALVTLLALVRSAAAISGDGNHITYNNGVIAFTGLVTPAEGGTGANNTATSGRYLRGTGTTFATSAVAAGGAGSCTNQFVRATNDNAAPTCAAVALATDVSGILGFANGGTGLGSAADDTVMVSNGSAWEAKALTVCTGAGKALTYDTSGNTFGCNTISGGLLAYHVAGTAGDVTTSQTVFVSGAGIDGNEGMVSAPLPAGTNGNLRCKNSAIQGVGNNVAVTARVGACGSEADTTLTCTITGSASANQACSDTSNSAVTTAGQCMSLKVVTPASLTANARVTCSWERTA